MKAERSKGIGPILFSFLERSGGGGNLTGTCANKSSFVKLEKGSKNLKLTDWQVTPSGALLPFAPIRSQRKAPTGYTASNKTLTIIT